MIPKLTDFSKEELQYAIDLIRADLNINISFRTLGFRLTKEENTCCQWLTKLTEALQEVERNERIQSN